MEDAVRRAMEQLAKLVDDLARRIAAIESRLADLDRKHEAVAAAQRAWRSVMVTRNELLLTSDAGDRATLSLPVARALAAGRALDVDRRETADGRVELVDVRGKVVGDLPLAALLSLSRVLASAETSRHLGSAVRVQPVQTVRPVRVLTPPAPGSAGPDRPADKGRTT